MQIWSHLQKPSTHVAALWYCKLIVTNMLLTNFFLTQTISYIKILWLLCIFLNICIFYISFWYNIITENCFVKTQQSGHAETSSSLAALLRDWCATALSLAFFTLRLSSAVHIRTYVGTNEQKVFVLEFNLLEKEKTIIKFWFHSKQNKVDNK